MLRRILMGTAAGAVGTVALDVVTYLDMAIRGRPPSEVPAKTAEKIAAGLGAPIDAGGAAAHPETRAEQEQRARGRAQGLGALLGYGAGLGAGAIYALVRPSLGNLPLPLAALGLGAAAMAAGDLPPVSLGVTDPRGWGAAGWLADIVPHLAYGLVTAAAYEAFSGGELGRRPTSGPVWALAAARHSVRRLRA
jgi:hypothetical protein